MPKASFDKYLSCIQEGDFENFKTAYKIAQIPFYDSDSVHLPVYYFQFKLEQIFSTNVGHL